MVLSDMARREWTPAGRSKGTGGQKVYDAVRDRILRLDLAPGQSIDEQALMDSLQVSRTPVREALIRLAGDDLVQLVPNRGAWVVPLQTDETGELIEALELYIRLSNQWAAIRRTDADIIAIEHYKTAWRAAAEARDRSLMTHTNNEFHAAVAQASHNPFLISMYPKLLPGFLRLSYAIYTHENMTSPDYRAYFEKIDDEHGRMLAAIRRGDPSAADAVATQHAEQMRERMRRQPPVQRSD